MESTLLKRGLSAAVALALTLVAVLGTAGHAAADTPPYILELEPGDGKPLYWDPAWGEFSTEELVLTGFSVATALSAIVIGPNESSPWRPTLSVDEDVRVALRLDTEQERLVARDISDIFLTLATSYPFVVDALIVATWHRESPGVGTQLALIDSEVIAVTLALQSVVKVVASRERPYGRTCGGEIPQETQACEQRDRYQSFFSGHSALTFASAAVTCSHHLNLPLYGKGTAAVPCATGFLMAGMTATLRMIGDKHYFSDVVTGAVVGTLVGFGIPYLFHYRHGSVDIDDDREPGISLSVVPTAASDGLGATAVGRF